MKKDTLLEKGATLLSLYTVESDPFVGGMGQVFRVRHTGWKVDLAMKQPKGELFRDEKQKAAFIGECDHWIKLGLHPHIVSCYYVREIDGVPSIFAEWMDGGSLKGFIESEALYEGNAMERILDISIQFARGLKYAHEQGLIHQDVKPDNLLLTSDGRAKVLTAKVADFGIANARAVVTGMSEISSATGDKTIVVKGHAYTPAYCSPEQKARKALTRRTDIWSWAVSVLEMFMGDRLWMDGTVAGLACDDYFGMERIPTPEAMKNLLRWCFKENEADRPHDFGIVEAELLKIYQSETGNAYPRPESKAATLTADSLNNRALSYIDLGKPEEAEKCWEEAVKIDPNSSINQYNYSLHLWQINRIDDAEAVHRLSIISRKDVIYYHCMAKLNIARCDAESAIECINEAIINYGETEELKQALCEAKDMLEKRLDGRCICTLVGHTSKIHSVNFCSDGRLALSGSGDNTMKLWDITTGNCLYTFVGHTGQVYSVCFSPNGRLALSGSEDTTVKVWDVTTGQCIFTLKGHSLDVRSVCFSQNGRFAISGSGDCTIKVWDMATGKCLYTFAGHSHAVTSVSISQDSRMVISGSMDQTVRLWDMIRGQYFRTLKTHIKEVRWEVESVCFSPNGLLALAGGTDKWVRLYHTGTGESVRILKGHTDSVWSVYFSPDGRFALSGSGDNTLKVWDIKTGKCLITYKGHVGDVFSVCFSPNGRSAISGSYDKTLKVWSIPVDFRHEFLLSRIQSSERAVSESKLFHDMVSAIDRLIAQKEIHAALEQIYKLRKIESFASGDMFFDCSRKLASFCIFHKLNRYVSYKYAIGEDTKVNDIYLNRNKNMILTKINQYGTVFISDIITGSHQSLGYDWYNSMMCFSPDGRLAFTGSKFWDIETGKCISTVEKKRGDNMIDAVCISSNNKIALLVEWGVERFWDIGTGKFIQSLRGHTERVCSVCFSPDNILALTGSFDKTVKIWDVATGDCIRTLEGHSDRVISVSFSPDSKLVISGSWDKTVRIWSVSTGKCLYTLEGPYIHSCCFSPDGRLALSGSENTVKLWNFETGACIQTFQELTHSIHKVCFSTDGRKIAAVTKREVYLYAIDFDLEFPGWHDWDEGARPYLNIFLTLYPDWKDEDFDNILIPDLQRRGFGWLRPEGVRAKLEEMSLIK